MFYIVLTARDATPARAAMRGGAEMVESKAAHAETSPECEPDTHDSDSAAGIPEGLHSKQLVESEQDERGGEQGRLFLHGYKATVRGRTLQLILWLAAHQTRINAIHSEGGQLWLTWKGTTSATIEGSITVRL
jgi:hypothetical protein